MRQTTRILIVPTKKYVWSLCFKSSPTYRGTTCVVSLCLGLYRVSTFIYLFKKLKFIYYLCTFIIFVPAQADTCEVYVQLRFVKLKSNVCRCSIRKRCAVSWHLPLSWSVKRQDFRSDGSQNCCVYSVSFGLILVTITLFGVHRCRVSCDVRQ